MPPVKVRLSINVDGEIAEYLERLHNEAVKDAIDGRLVKPSFSSFVNEWLREAVRRDRVARSPRGQG